MNLLCALGRHDWTEFGDCRRNPLHVRMSPSDWAAGVRHLRAGTEWSDGPWSRVADRRHQARREAGLALQARLAEMGEDVSLELCKDAAWDWPDHGASLVAVVAKRRREALASTSTEGETPA